MSIIRKIFVSFLEFVFSLKFERKYFKEFKGSKYTVFNWAIKCFFHCFLLRLGKAYKFPASHKIRISNPDNLIFDPADLNLFQSEGCYFQNFSAKIIIGKGSYIAPNVGIITANHDPEDLSRHLPGKDVIIGNSVWIGMNSILLPGIKLADGIIVGAGSVVTKSFTEKNIIIAGNPAKKIREKNVEV